MISESDGVRGRIPAWGFLVAACLWSLVMLIPVLLHEGWPVNHDFVAPVLRMGAIVDQWGLGRSVPVWSTAQQFAHGSPMPVLYHKTHMYLSAGVLALTGNIKVSLVLPLFLLMVTGFLGMCFCLRHALGGRHPWLWLLGGALLLASNYAFTDWVVRGAFAEFAALMFLPWLFAWCLILINEARWSLWIGPGLALMALTHASLGLFALVPLAITLVVGIARWGKQALRWLPPAFFSACLAVVVMLPFALPMVAASRFNRVEFLTAFSLFKPRLNGVPWHRYFWDAEWEWSGNMQGFTAQLDTGLLLLVPVYVLLLRWPRSLDHIHRRDMVVADRWNAVFLLGSLMVMAWLQLPQAVWVYESVPGAEYLQFAWRLLAYLTVILIMCACVALSRMVLVGEAYGLAALVAAAVLLVCTAYPKLWWNWTAYTWIPDAMLQEQRVQGDYLAFGEFWPLVDWDIPDDDLLNAGAQVNAWRAQPLVQTCTLKRMESAVPRPRERSVDEWQAVCPEAAKGIFPLFLAPGMDVLTRKQRQPHWSAATISRTCSDPRLQVSLPQGVSEIRIKSPNWSRMVVAGFTRQDFDFHRDCAIPAR